MTYNRNRALNCLCGVLMLFVNLGMISTAFSAHFPYIRELKDFTNTQVYLITTVRSIFAMLVMSRADRFCRFFEIRRGSMLTFATAALGFGIMAFTPDPRLYYVSAALFGIAYGLGGMIPVSILLKRWYPEGSGTAIGIAATGSGIAGMVIPPFVTFIVERFGLAACFVAESALILLLLVPLAAFMKDKPEAGELSKDNGQADTMLSAEGDGCREDEAIRSGKIRQRKESAEPSSGFRIRDHYRLLGGMIIMGLLGFQPAAGFSMLFRTSGYEMGRVALTVSLLGLFLIPGKILVGRFADRYGGRRMLRDCTCILSAMLLLFSLTARLPYPVIVAAMMAFAFGISEVTVGISVIAGDFTSPEHYAKALKSCQFFYALGGLLFSTVNGITADLTGSYAPAYMFYALAGMILLAVLLPAYPKSGKNA